jgi:hypothetical protein
MIEQLSYLDVIRERLSDPELLANLAEEAAELAQAALKMRRVMDGSNPTPVTFQEAHEKLLEEITDVENLVAALLYNTPTAVQARAEIRAVKLERWAERLMGIYEG